MEERFEISFSEGGVGTLETIITAGLAKAVEKTLDTVTGDDNHGWDCTIKDTITELKVTCWGVTKEEAQEKALKEIWEEIEDFENEREKEEEEEREHEKERIRLEEEEAERKRISEDSSNNESSTEKGCAKIIAWIVGIGLAAYLVIWLAINVVLPIALLNSALILTILSFVFKKQKTLFASLSLVGGVYMLLDATNGWFSANFVEDIVKDPVWISAFIYINAAAIGLSVWSLIKPVWMRTEKIDSTDKRKPLILKGLIIVAIFIATAIAPLIYHVVHNRFIQKTNHNEINYQYQSDAQNNENGESKTQTTIIENQVIVDTYLGTIGEKEFKLFIEKVEGENVEGYNVTGSNRRPVKGKIVNIRTEPTGLGGNYTIYKLILTEPGDDKWDGEFNIDLWISDIDRHGQGNWKSYNGKLERQIKIKDRLNE